jgi:DHA3 family macrolide efflux protein-like MFS transporter
MPVDLILSVMFADLVGVNNWFFISGILIIAIALIYTIVPTVRALDDK